MNLSKNLKTHFQNDEIRFQNEDETRFQNDDETRFQNGKTR